MKGTKVLGSPSKVKNKANEGESPKVWVFFFQSIVEIIYIIYEVQIWNTISIVRIQEKTKSPTTQTIQENKPIIGQFQRN